MYKKERNFRAIVTNFGAFFSFFTFFARSFPEGVIIVPKILERSPINLNSTRKPISYSGKTGN